MNLTKNCDNYENYSVVVGNVVNAREIRITHHSTLLYTHTHFSIQQ